MEHSLFTFHGRRPPLVVSLSSETPEETVPVLRNALCGGADGFLIHLERFDPVHRDVESLKKLFSHADGLPIMSLNYRNGKNVGIPDEELTETQFAAIDAGAGCVDVMADLFDPMPEQLTVNKTAVKKQLAYIDEIHKRGAQVLMSAHTSYKTTEELFYYMDTMCSRGADIAKISMKCTSDSEVTAAIQSTAALREHMTIPFLLICNGKYGRAHRVLAPLLGSCMVLCVERYAVGYNREKTLLHSAKAIYDNLDYSPYL